MNLKKLENILLVFTCLVVVIDIFFEAIIPKDKFHIFVGIMVVTIIANIIVLIINRVKK